MRSASQTRIPPAAARPAAAVRAAAVAALAALSVLPPGAAQAQSSAVVAEQRGWVVEAYTVPAGEGAEIRYCVASRQAAPDFRLAFVATRTTLGVLLGVPGAAFQAGALHPVEIRIDRAEPTAAAARVVNPETLSVLREGTDVEAALAPYARGSRLRVSGQALGGERTAGLDGSSWAIRTLAACRAAILG
jgi:hypothetical protein